MSMNNPSRAHPHPSTSDASMPPPRTTHTKPIFKISKISLNSKSSGSAINLGARWGHSSCLVDNKKLFIIGGIGNNLVHDTCLFDFGSLAWTEAHASGKSPGSRYGHATVLLSPPSLAERSCILLFGGRNIAKKYFNDLYLLDTTSLTWTCINADKTFPDPRAGHTAVLASHSSLSFPRLVIFGGNHHNKYLNNVYIMDVISNDNFQWSKPNVKGTPPCPRSGHTCTHIPNTTKMLVFGGFDGKKCFNDVYIFCAATFTWSHVTPHGTAPRPRSGHTAALVGDRFWVIFGGCSDAVFLNDFHILDLKGGGGGATGGGEPVLHWLPQPTLPLTIAPRFHHSCDTVDHSIVIFGGCASGALFNDMVSMDVSPLFDLPDYPLPQLRSPQTTTSTTSTITTTTTTTTTTSTPPSTPSSTPIFAVPTSPATPVASFAIPSPPAARTTHPTPSITSTPSSTPPTTPTTSSTPTTPTTTETSTTSPTTSHAIKSAAKPASSPPSPHSQPPSPHTQPLPYSQPPSPHTPHPASPSPHPQPHEPSPTDTPSLAPTPISPPQQDTPLTPEHDPTPPPLPPTLSDTPSSSYSSPPPPPSSPPTTSPSTPPSSSGSSPAPPLSVLHATCTTSFPEIPSLKQSPPKFSPNFPESRETTPTPLEICLTSALASLSSEQQKLKDLELTLARERAAHAALRADFVSEQIKVKELEERLVKTEKDLKKSQRCVHDSKSHSQAAQSQISSLRAELSKLTEKLETERRSHSHPQAHPHHPKAPPPQPTPQPTPVHPAPTPSPSHPPSFESLLAVFELFSADNLTHLDLPVLMQLHEASTRASERILAIKNKKVEQLIASMENLRLELAASALKQKEDSKALSDLSCKYSKLEEEHTKEKENLRNLVGEGLENMDTAALEKLEEIHHKGLRNVGVAKTQALAQQVARLQREKEELVAGVVCVVCADGVINTILAPCGHRCMCKSCADLLSCCPLCRKPIQDKLTYFP